MGFKTGIVVGILMCLGWQHRAEIYKEYKRVHVKVTYEAQNDRRIEKI